ncbi:hypothetical protein ES703_97938 [subsurface metagenome]
MADGWKGIKHKPASPIDEELTQEEWERETGHELAHGPTNPETGNDGDFFYNTDEHRLYIYVE